MSETAWILWVLVSTVLSLTRLQRWEKDPDNEKQLRWTGRDRNRVGRVGWFFILALGGSFLGLAIADLAS